MLDAGVDRVGLLVRWAGKDVQRRPVWSRARLGAATLGALEENVLYTFTRR